MRIGFVSVAALGLVAGSAVKADTVHLSVGQKLERFSDLTPGVRRYIRYLVNKDGSRQLVDGAIRRWQLDEVARGKRTRRVIEHTNS